MKTRSIKAKKKAPEQGELIKEKPEAWIVRVAMWTEKTCPALAGTINGAGPHKLCYNNRTILTAKGMQNLRRLEAIAKLGNATEAEPRVKIDCAADAPNPEKYLEKIRYSTPTSNPTGSR